MNVDLVLRAIQRHRHMNDAPAYEMLLARARDHGGVWFAPQAEVAAWWERRNAARLVAERVGNHVRVTVDLDGAVLEVDGALVTEGRYEFAWSGNEIRFPTAHGAASGGSFVREILRHLGYGHVDIVEAGADTELSGPEWEGLLQTLAESSRVHQRFEPATLESVRSRLAAAHRRFGWPDLRLWPWPVVDGTARRCVLSPRYDVDKAIVNLPQIHDLEARYGARSTVYLRPMGMFYGAREIRACRSLERGHEIGLHGEFMTTAEQRFGTEEAAAVGERARLVELTGASVDGVCMHGGELRTNTGPRTRDAIEAAGYLYETMFRNRYHFPLHVQGPDGPRKTLSIGQHFADITVPLTPDFADELGRAFVEQFDAAARVGGMFVPVMHPLYFSLSNYLSYPTNLARIVAFLPRFAVTAAQMKRGQAYSNRVQKEKA